MDNDGPIWRKCEGMGELYNTLWLDYLFVFEFNIFVCMRRWNLHLKFSFVSAVGIAHTCTQYSSSDRVTFIVKFTHLGCFILSPTHLLLGQPLSPKTSRMTPRSLLCVTEAVILQLTDLTSSLWNARSMWVCLEFDLCGVASWSPSFT